MTWVSLHYFSTAGPDAAGNAYYAMEHSNPTAFAFSAGFIDVPLGVTRFEQDVVSLPKIWNHTLGPVVYEAEYKKGGHFAAWERPDAIVLDLRMMLAKSGAVFKSFDTLLCHSPGE